MGDPYYGWRFATREEVQKLWKSFGLSDGIVSDILVTDESQYQAFTNAVALLGNTVAHIGIDSAYGAWGYNGELVHGSAIYSGMSIRSFDTVTSAILGNVRNSIDADPRIGSYLVQVSSVPVPAAAWLFSSALVGLVGFNLKKL